MSDAAVAPAVPRPRPRNEYWICQACGWGTYLVFTYIQTHEPPGRVNAGDLETLFAACYGVGLTHAFRGLLLWRGWLSMKGAALVLRAVAAPVALAAIFVAPLVVIELGLLGHRPPSPATMAMYAVIRWTLVFGVWETIYLTVTHRLEVAVALQAAHLRSLQAQLNPHFLFNALNTVRALIPEDPERAQAAVTQLASILRHALQAGRNDVATLEDEMTVVDDYLAIESLRLGDRLRVERSLEPGALRASVPALLLQTLVENAVKHGIAELQGGGTLGICAKVADGAILLTVDNPRPLEQDRARSMEAHNGIGLANATERLRLLFGGKAKLEIDLSQPRHATARVRIPLRP